MQRRVWAIGLAVAGSVGCGTFSPAYQTGGGGLRTFNDPPPIEIDARAAHAHAAFLSAPELKGRDSASEGDHEATRYAEEYLKGLGFATARQDFTHWSFKGTAQNLIALVPGKSADKFVVIGAHKDHIGIGWSGKVYPGANDNAGGSAGVLEVGAALKRRIDRGDRPEPSVLLMLFSGEEKGLVGSTYYTKNPGVPTADGKLSPIGLKQIKGMVALDVIANGQPDKFDTDTAGATSPELRAEIERLAARYRMTTQFRSFVEHRPHGVHAQELPPGATSDHAAFRRAGIQAVLFYAEPLHKYLHHPDDTVQERDRFQKDPDNVFNDAKLAKLAQLGLDQALAWGTGRK
ncbi:MAG: M28 family peptidase [Candidatus Sericytochromatia bacterium]|nr:M28 family peptidase [Candidatus Tanganyikabacteria bacterium]